LLRELTRQQSGDPDHEAAALGQDHQHRLGDVF
jgi:hypothetical protein